MATIVASAAEAASQNDWQVAYDLYVQAAEQGELPPDSYRGMATAAFWLGKAAESDEAREHAYTGYMRDGDELAASLMALDIAEGHFHRKEAAQGMGWVHTAERLLGKHPESIEHGWLKRMLAVIAFEGEGDLEGGQALAEEAYELACRFESRDLQAISLHDQGRIRAARGDIDGGMALMDEAMVAAMSGELGSLYTGKIYCNMIDICEQLADYQRAGDWSDAAKRWCERAGHNGGFPGVCRVHRAEIMRLRGEWDLAEEEARRASSELGAFVDFAGEAYYEIGEIRFHMGDLDAADEYFHTAHSMGRDPLPGLADLELTRGRPDSAWKLINRGLLNVLPPLKRARLLPSKVEIGLALDERDEAAAAVDELSAIAEDYETPALGAYYQRSIGQLAAHDGDGEKAVGHFRQAVELFRRNGFPYLAAKTRVDLAHAYRSVGSDQSAELEINTARGIFEDLGARADAQRAADLQVRGRSGARTAIGMMFTDIVDSTPLIGVIGDEAWEQLLRWHHRTLRSLIGGHNGHEVENTGDGFFASFESTDSALECALAIQRRLHQQRIEHGFAPKVRIGLHAGEVTDTGSSLAGEQVHKAARISGQAQADEIVASVDFTSALSEPVRGHDESLVELKGFSEPVELVRIPWA